MKLIYDGVSRTILITLITNGKRPFNMARLSHTIHSTYSHTNKILKVQREQGLVNFQKVGRDIIITLTEKGRKVAELFKEMQEIVEDE